MTMKRIGNWGRVSASVLLLANLSAVAQSSSSSKINVKAGSNTSATTANVGSNGSVSAKAAGSSVISAKKLSKKVTFVFASELSKDFDKSFTQSETGTENSISATFEPLEDHKFSVSIVNSYNFVGARDLQSKEQAMYRDLSFSLARTLGPVLGTEKTPIKYIFNLPTSQSSIDKNQAFSIGTELTFEYDLGNHLTSTTVINPSWAIRNGEADGLRSRMITEVGYEITDRLSTSVSLSHAFKMLTEDKPKVEQSTLDYGVGVAYSPNSILDLGLSLSRSRHLVEEGENKNKSKRFSLLDSSEMSYGASASVKF